MVFRAQREVLELAFQLELTSDRLSHLARYASFDLRMATERGIPPEDIERKVTVLELVDGELARVERELRRCRELIERVFKTLGYGSPLLSLYTLDDEQG